MRGDAIVPGDGAGLRGCAGPGGGQAGARVTVGLQQDLVGRAGPGVLSQRRAGRAGRTSHHRVRLGLLHRAPSDLQTSVQLLDLSVLHILVFSVL